MSEFEQALELLLKNDGVVVKLPEGTVIDALGDIVFDASESALYISAKKLNDEVLEPILNDFNNYHSFKQEIKLEILEPGKQWKTGKIRLRLVLEFIPDKPENNKITGDSVSSLDELRKMNL